MRNSEHLARDLNLFLEYHGTSERTRDLLLILTCLLTLCVYLYTFSLKGDENTNYTISRCCSEDVLVGFFICKSVLRSGDAVGCCTLSLKIQAEIQNT